jgi:DNA-binding HxlR family transcriptional regulator/putative sterol carrier protein
MSRKSYHQFCGLARSLDVVGERWTLLVIRELMFGPRRFVDVLEALPGIGSNTLTTRLRSLEEDGLITRETLPPPAASTVYTLTPAGQELEPVVIALGRWGMRRLEAGEAGNVFRPEWMLFGLKAAVGDAADEMADCDYQFRIDGSPILLRVRDGRVDVTATVAPAPDVTLDTDAATIKDIGLGNLTPTQAVKAGRVKVSGDRALLAPLLQLMNMATARA